MQIDREQRSVPPWWRVLLGFLVAPAAAALLAATLQPGYDGLPNFFERVWRTAVFYGVFGAFPTAMFIGLPAFFLLRHRLAPTAINCALVGAIIAALPWTVITLLPQAADEASIGGRLTIIDGQLTAYGWLMQGKFVGAIALFGFAGGVIFWVVVAAARKPKPLP